MGNFGLAILIGLLFMFLGLFLYELSERKSLEYKLENEELKKEQSKKQHEKFEENAKINDELWNKFYQENKITFDYLTIVANQSKTMDLSCINSLFDKAKNEGIYFECRLATWIRVNLRHYFYKSNNLEYLYEKLYIDNKPFVDW